MEHSYFNMDLNIEVLLGNAKSSDSMVVRIVKNTHMRARYAKYHVISLTEARERAI